MDTIIKCKSRTEMAYEFGVDRKTFRSMLAKYNVNLPPGLISPADQRKIYKIMGEPKNELLK